MRKRLTSAAAIMAVAGSLWAGSHWAQAQAGGALPADKYTWLEDVSGSRSMDWVKNENARTEKVLDADPRYAANYADALKLAEDPNRLAVPSLRAGVIYNQWRDATNPRGLLRKTTVADYLTPQPHWQTVIDFDALGRAEKTGWVSDGLNCLYPGNRYCMVALSAGGEDALTEREFDLQTGQFVPGGFVSQHSKQALGWIDKDNLVIARDWGPGTMTQSGYALVVKEWRRGTPIESAKEIFRGQPTDQVGTRPEVLHDADGHSLELIRRAMTFFESETYVRTRKGVERLMIPAKAEVTTLVSGRVIVELHADWTPAGQGKTFRQGSLVEMKLDDVLRDPAHLHPAVVFEPTSTEFYQSSASTENHLVVTTLENVQGRAYVYTPAPDGWSRKRLAVPDNASVRIVSTSDQNNQFFLAITGFLLPPSVWLGDAAGGTLQQARSEPPLFDASQDVVEQFFATSADGTRVPYFVVHRKGMKYDGSNPTLLNAYGGFEVSETPNYSSYLGRLWLEKGGVFVLANIRGGGEFGPAWHEAGLKTNRQRIYDDFAAVAQDLITRQITSPRHLGIQGGSNGGLLMGVEMEQHPALWNAVVIQVPLLDMLGYEHIAAGQSWVGEYGSINNPDERAFLARISPYNQLKPDGKYPEPLIFTTTKDDRVGPQHARKFAAKMEEYHEPFFYEEITEGGHGVGADTKQEAGTYALTYTYLARKLM